MKRVSFRLISNFHIHSYACGVKAGDILRLRHDIVVRDHTGSATGCKFSAGEFWKVLPGSKDDAGIIRLMQPDGKLHTWDDDASLFDVFEVVQRGKK